GSFAWCSDTKRHKGSTGRGHVGRSSICKTPFSTNSYCSCHPAWLCRHPVSSIQIFNYVLSSSFLVLIVPNNTFSLSISPVLVLVTLHNNDLLIYTIKPVTTTIITIIILVHFLLCCTNTKLTKTKQMQQPESLLQ